MEEKVYPSHVDTACWVFVGEDKGVYELSWWEFPPFGVTQSQLTCACS